MPIRFLQVGQNTAEHNRLFGTNNLPLHTFTTIFYTEFLGHQMKKESTPVCESFKNFVH